MIDASDDDTSARSRVKDSGVPLPLYYQVLSVIRQRIMDRSYAPGERLASEDELAAEFAVSRATIRQAVGELVRQGMVVRQQGKGTFVQDMAHYASGQRFRGSLADLISETQRTKVLTVEVLHGVVFPEQVVDAFGGLASTGTLVRRQRTMDGQVFAYTVNYLPEPFGSMVSKDELQTTGLMTLLEQKGVVFVGGHQAIRAELADVEVARWLDADFGSPVLFIERVLVDAGGSPCELIYSHYRGDRYEFTVSLELTDKEGSAIRAQLA